MPGLSLSKLYKNSLSLNVLQNVDIEKLAGRTQLPLTVRLDSDRCCRWNDAEFEIPRGNKPGEYVRDRDGAFCGKILEWVARGDMSAIRPARRTAARPQLSIEGDVVYQSDAVPSLKDKTRRNSH